VCSEQAALNDHIALLTRESEKLRRSNHGMVPKEHLDSVPPFPFLIEKDERGKGPCVNLDTKVCLLRIVW
jgi:hypothetical protein